MKLLSFSAQNFLSYKSIDFTFDKGLIVIAGPTGSGKSSLIDLPVWILFGVTSKKLDAKQSIKWNEDKTIGTLTVLVDNKLIKIVRTRTKTTQDLYYTYDNNEVRGTNIKDTQQKLEEFLKVSKDDFIDGAYYSDLSFSNIFYNAPASARHAFFENTCDFSFISELKNKLDLQEKNVFKHIQNYDISLEVNQKRILWLTESYERAKKNLIIWTNKQKTNKNDTLRRKQEFNTHKLEKIEHYENEIVSYRNQTNLIKLKLSEQVDVCSACGSKNAAYYQNLQDLALAEQKMIIVTKDLKKVTSEKYIEPIDHMTSDPLFEKEMHHLKIDLDVEEITRNNLTQKKTEHEQTLMHIAILKHALYTLKAKQLYNIIKYLEVETNNLLKTYFNSLFVITLTSELKDSIDVEISHQTNSCSYTQLSKGQKQVLKLCTAVTIMKLHKLNTSTNSNVLFFDEAFDGMDTEYKLMAMEMLNSLTSKYDSVYLIDHLPDLQVMASTKINIERINDESNVIYE